MEQAMNRSVLQFSNGTVIFPEREKVDKIGLLVKGRVEAIGPSCRLVLQAGNFFGIYDTIDGRYECTYRALEDCIVCMFQVSDLSSSIELIIDSSDYCGLVIPSLIQQSNMLAKSYKEIMKIGHVLCKQIQNYVGIYENIAHQYNLEYRKLMGAENIIDEMTQELKERVRYYQEISQFNIDSLKNFYSQGKVIIKYHIEDLTRVIGSQLKLNRSMLNNLIRAVGSLNNNTSSSIYYEYINLTSQIDAEESGYQNLIKVIQQMIDLLNRIENVIENNCNLKITIQRDRMVEAYQKVISGKKIVVEEEVEAETLMSEEEILHFAKGSLDQILSYGEINAEEAERFDENLCKFGRLRDRFSTEDDVRMLRKHILDDFYHIYESVFRKSLNDKQCPKVIRLFLRYGYMDERLLTKEQIVEIWRLHYVCDNAKIKVYTMDEWLTQVYRGKRSPSKNEFDMDYSEALRHDFQKHVISEQEYQKGLEDADAKLHYEIVNMFQYNNRVVSGKITTFVPVLFEEVFYGEVNRYVVDAKRIEEIIEQITEVDFSLFYRECAHVNKAAGIEREYIMKEVYPEVILMPSFGEKSVMWQDISERRRDTPARFVLPVLTDVNLEELLLKLCSKFRWEMCRTIQGTAWNNIKYRSLTSEYVDYLQFYRKNRELSEEKKEKVKSQLVKCGNRVADVFSLDYEVWVKAEYQGAVRLNKTARKILSMYCPFSKEIRNKLLNTPIFAEPINAYEIERQKKVKEHVNHYKSLQNSGITLTKALTDTLEFYQDK